MFQTLGRSLDEAAVLRLACEACGHTAVWRREVALARLGPDASPFAIRRRLMCGACGARRVAVRV